MNACLWAPAKIKIGCAALVSCLAAGLIATASAEPSLRILKGANQRTVYAAAFPAPLVVWVADPATQQSLEGVRVDFTAGEGIQLSSAFAVTDEHGLASVAAVGMKACASGVTAEIAGAPASKVDFGALIVDKATLTVVPVDMQTTVGGGVPAITGYTIQGFVNGDTEATARIAGAPVLTTTAKDNSPHANYAIKGGVGTLSAPNYTFVAGFGTLAVLGGPASGSDAAPIQEASVDTGEKAGEVRPALLNQPAANSLRQPAFLAGLRGESGVFVQTAISQPVSHASASRTSLAPVRNAIAPKVATISTSLAPVRAAVTAKSASIAPLAQIPQASVRAAVAHSAAAAPSRQVAGGSVRAVALPATPAVAATSSPSLAASTIRKALNPPGAK